MQQPAKKVEPKCSVCYHVFAESDARFVCKRKDVGCNVQICAGEADACFALWVGGSKRDNRGFLAAKCFCGVEIAHDEVRKYFGSDELFDKYDEALMKQCLMREGDAVFCPGPDCKNGMIRPAIAKGVSACRSTVCSEPNCQTEFCIMCSEKFVQGDISHAKLSCKSFKVLLDKQSGVGDWSKQKRKGLIKCCPGCKRMTEKNEGCNSHFCVLCSVYFCWRCCAIDCQCHIASERKQRRYIKWKARKDKERLDKLAAEKLAAEKAKQNVVVAQAGNNNNAVVVAAVGNNAGNNNNAVVAAVGNNAGNNAVAVAPPVQSQGFLSGVVREILNMIPSAGKADDFDMLRSSA